MSVAAKSRFTLKKRDVTGTPQQIGSGQPRDAAAYHGNATTPMPPMVSTALAHLTRQRPRID